MAERLTDAQRRALVTRVRELGALRGLKTDTAIEEAAGLPPRTVGGLAKGTQGPTLHILLALGEGLRVYSIDQLLGFSQTTFFARIDDVEAALGGRAAAMYAELQVEV